MMGTAPTLNESFDSISTIDDDVDDDVVEDDDVKKGDEQQVCKAEEKITTTRDEDNDSNNHGLYAYADLDFETNKVLYTFGNLVDKEKVNEIKNKDNEELNWNCFLLHRSSDEGKGNRVIGTAVQQRQHKLIPSIMMKPCITGIMQQIEPNVQQQPQLQQHQQQEIILQQQVQRQQKQHDKYISTALQEQKERLQAQQKKTSKQNRVKKRKQQQQQKHKYKRDREQIKTRLGQDNKQIYQLETAQQNSNKQQQYFKDFFRQNEQQYKDNPEIDKIRN